MLITIAGILVTVVFGILSVLFYIYPPTYLIRRNRYPARITFVEHICLDLFDSIVLNIPGLRLTYNDQEVGEDIVLLNGYLVNTGWKDITQGMVEECLSLVLPTDYKWLKTVASSPYTEVSAELASDDHELVFHTGLFRQEEYIEFTALVQVPSRKQVSSDGEGGTAAHRLRRDMSFRHRISDMQSIEERSLEHPSISKHRYVVKGPVRISRRSLLVLLGAVPLGVLALALWVISLLPDGGSMPPTVISSSSGRGTVYEWHIVFSWIFIGYLFTVFRVVISDYIAFRQDVKLRKLLSLDET